MKKILLISPNIKTNHKNKKFYGIDLIKYRNKKNINIIRYKINFYKSYKIARKLENELAKKLIKYLNLVHGTNYSKKEWYIYIGYWLRRYSNIIVNRFLFIKHCSNVSDEIFILKNKEKFFYINDSIDFNYMSSNTMWNIALIEKILPYLGIKKKIIFKDTSYDLQHYNKNNFNKSFRYQSAKFLDKLLSPFTSKNDNMIMISKITKISLIKIFLYCKQIPRFLITPNYEASKKNFVLRKKLKKDFFIKDHKDKIFQCANNLLFDCLPISYLEDFTIIDKISNNLNWPLFPKKIICDNHFDTNEIFKLKVLNNKAFNKTKFYIIQHGNNYGTTIHTIDNPEEFVADKFFNWGWRSKKKNVIRFFSHSVKKNKQVLKGSMCLYLDHKPNFDLPWNNFDEWEEYLESQTKFIANLNDKVKKNFYIKFNDFSNEFNSIMEKKINFKKYKIQIYDSSKNWSPEISIFGYDGTGFLENLSDNKPTIGFWDIDRVQLRVNIKKDYKKLEKNCLIFKNPIKAAKFINDNYKDIHNWWSKKKTKKSVTEFSSLYSRKTINIEKKIADELTK